MKAEAATFMTSHPSLTSDLQQVQYQSGVYPHDWLNQSCIIHKKSRTTTFTLESPISTETCGRKLPRFTQNNTLHGSKRKQETLTKRGDATPREHDWTSCPAWHWTSGQIFRPEELWIKDELLDWISQSGSSEPTKNRVPQSTSVDHNY